MTSQKGLPPKNSGITQRQDAELRSNKRHKIFEPVIIVYSNGSEQRAHLLDVSSTGALIHSSEAPPIGAVLDLHGVETRLSARVMWSRDSRFGVRFEQRLGDAAIAGLLR